MLPDAIFSVIVLVLWRFGIIDAELYMPHSVGCAKRAEDKILKVGSLIKLRTWEDYTSL